jgi:transcriptional repressor NrdR
MRCPFCGKLDNKVIDSRLSQAGEVTRRRRECEACNRRYTTYERVDHGQLLPMVLKKEGRREPFSRDKALAGLRRACVKRNVAPETLERIVDQLEREITENGTGEVATREIGERLMAALKDLDQVAYVRFASVYRDFKDVHEFLAELSELVNGDGPR